MSKVLVTGGAGFIGSHLVESLVKNNYEVVVLDSLLRGNKIPKSVQSKITFIKGDVRNKDLVDEISRNCKYIFHLAAILGVEIVADNHVETMEIETTGTKNICDAALKNKVKKVIYASTSGIYGHSAIEKSVDEDIMVDPRTSYSIAKRYNEIYLKSLFDETKLNSISLRLFNVYGPRQDIRMVIPRFIEQAKGNEDITVYGNGLQTRDFTYINDVIKSILLLAEKVDGCEIFNIAYEKETTILDLAKQIKKTLKSTKFSRFIRTKYGASKLYKTISKWR